MERKELDTKYTWDLSLIYQNEAEYQKDLNQAKKILEDCLSFKGKLSNSVNHYYDFLTLETKLYCLINKLYCYANLNCDVTPDNQTMQLKLAEVKSFNQQVTNALTFTDLEIIAHQEKIKELIKDPKLKNYVYYTNEILRQIPHTLSNEMEELLAETTKLASLSSNVFNSLRLEFKPVIINNQEHFLNQGTLNEFLKHDDAGVRKQAYENFFSEYQKFENVFANTLSGVMHNDAFYAKARNFSNSLEASLFNDNAPIDLFEKILEMANVKYRGLFHRYNALKKKKLGLEPFYNYDLNIPLLKEAKRKFEIEESFNIILNAVKPLGKDYQQIIQKAKKECWIDFLPHNKKRSGAYSSGSYDTKPYILMNFTGDYSSLSTLTHELGHSCHSYLSNKYQAPENANYRIFVAEVSSTVNELLLSQYLMQKTTSKEEKAVLLYELLEQCVGLIYRQPMFADFEYKLHTLDENNQPLSSQVITDLYTKLNQEYFEDDIKTHELVGISCYYIPHFYYNYYVYKYTLGMCVSLAIANRIQNNDQEQINKYLDFLKSGGSASPIDLLKEAGVDPTDDKLYIDAFNYFEKTLNEFESIIHSL